MAKTKSQRRSLHRTQERAGKVCVLCGNRTRHDSMWADWLMYFGVRADTARDFKTCHRCFKKREDKALWRLRL